MSGGLHTPEDYEWDEIRLKDLYHQFGGLDKVHDTHSAEVAREIAGEANKLKHFSVKEVAKKLRQRAVINDQQWLEITSDQVLEIDVANKLLQYFLHAAGFSYFRKTLPGILYCALLDTFEEDPSLEEHHHFAVNVLRLKVLQNLKVTGAEESSEVQVQRVVEKVPTLRLQSAEAQQLKQALNVQNCTSDDLKDITKAYCSASRDTSCNIGQLLEGFLCTRGLGKHVHGWMSYCHSNGPKVFHFLRNLGDHWKNLLHFYGFTEVEVHSLSVYEDDEEEITALLKVFWVPTANVVHVDDILERSRRAAGIATTARGSNVMAIVPASSSVAMSSESESHLVQLFRTAAVTNTLEAPMLSLPTAPSSLRESSQTLPRAIKYSGDNSPTTSKLLSACMQHNERKAVELIEAMDSLPDTRDENGKNALMHACMGRMMTVVECLIRKGADLSAVDKNGECCLHFTETLRNIQLLEMLVKEYKRAKVSVDLPSQSGWTPLGKACVCGTYKAAEILIGAGANPEGNIKGNCCPLLEVSARGYTKHVQLLLNSEVSPNLRNVHRNTPLLQAVRSQQWEVAIILLDAGADPNRTDIHAVSALFYAIKENSLETVRKLIEKNANVNATRIVNSAIGEGMNESVLALACALGHWDIVDLLVECGANLHYLCGGIMPPIGFAVLFNHIEVVKLLLDKEHMDKSITMLAAPIKAAVQAMRMKCAEMLLDELGGADKALQKAQETSLYSLVECISTFKMVKETGTYEDSRIGDNLLNPSQGRVLQIMHKFCQICASCVTSIPETRKDEILKLAESCNAQEVAIFLRQCYSVSREQENLHQDFLRGNPSPFHFLVQNKILTAENFQMEVLFQYGDEGQKFCEDLVWAFKQMQGAEGLPDNVEFVLQTLFSGHCRLGVRIGVRDIHGAHILSDQIGEGAAYPLNALPTADAPSRQASSVSQKKEKSDVFPSKSNEEVYRYKCHKTPSNQWMQSINGMLYPQSQGTRGVLHSGAPNAVDLKAFTRRAKPTGRTLGSGSFGKVEEMILGQKIVAGKKFYLSVTDDGSKRKFLDEVKFLAQLHHPNIVSFEGICHLENEQLPVILMERLDTNLYSYLLDPTHANLTNSRKAHILYDVANGLVYLHGLTPPLVHRDLTAKNVLLTSEKIVKIADFGNARILDIDPQSSNTMTSRPGTLEYMPPEAFGASAKYDSSLDVFSFGHLALFVAIQESPSSLLPYADGSKLRVELERRQKYLSKVEKLLKKDHPLMTIITQCLQNDPRKRPASYHIWKDLHIYVGKVQASDPSMLAAAVPTSVDNDCSSPKPYSMSSADQRPTIAQLQLLQIKGRRIDIIRTVAPKWQRLGDILSFDSDSRTVDVISKKHEGDPEGGCKEMFQMWLRGNGTQPVTWRTLAKLLEDSMYIRLASDIRACFSC